MHQNPLKAIARLIGQKQTFSQHNQTESERPVLEDESFLKEMPCKRLNFGLDLMEGYSNQNEDSEDIKRGTEETFSKQGNTAECDSDSQQSQDFELFRKANILNLLNEAIQQPENEEMLFDEKTIKSTSDPTPAFIAAEALSQGQLPKMPKYCKGKNYFEEFWRLQLQNDQLIYNLQREDDEKYSIQNKINKIEAFYDQNLDKLQSERYQSGRKRHHRRKADDIERKFCCLYPKCEKFYGSEGSLNLHIKLKHNGGNKTDREKIAKTILCAQQNGQQLSLQAMDVNLPPGAIEKVAGQIGMNIEKVKLKQIDTMVSALSEKKRQMEKQIEKSLKQSSQKTQYAHVNTPPPSSFNQNGRPQSVLKKSTTLNSKENEVQEAIKKVTIAPILTMDKAASKKAFGDATKLCNNKSLPGIIANSGKKGNSSVNKENSSGKRPQQTCQAQPLLSMRH